MRFLASVSLILVTLLGSTVWGQATRPPNRRIHRPQPQTPADFAPDPPPIPDQSSAPPPNAGLPAPPAGLAATPLASPTPAQAAPPENLPPATPPQVSFQNGLLTVVATNSNLDALLTAIRNKTGIQFEGMDSSAERVAITLGPAPEGDVLAAILDGSGFDYVVIERPDSPGIVQRVLLVPKGGTTPSAAAAGTQPAAARAAAADDDDEDASEEPATPQDTPVRPPVAQVTPPQAQPPQQKTPEQLYEELKKMPPAQPSTTPSTAPIKPH
jgi:hypothetical protein